jgi:predicted heme/steroid binding protein
MGHPKNICGTIVLYYSLMGILLVWPRAVHSTEEYAEKTGHDCAVCHLDPSGGGELTEPGKHFLSSLPKGPDRDGAEEKAPAKHLFSYFIRLIAGYVHILTAFLWFGTILYVHLILKPAYAARGLPQSETKIGLVSMAVMAVTGAILFAYRVPSFSFLVSTRFGVLLLIKIFLFLLMVCSALFVVFFIGPKLKSEKTGGPNILKGNLSSEELGQCDGKEGRPAYIGYKGEIYDVTQSKLWKNGAHIGRHYAGADLTEGLSRAPHSEGNVLSMPHVGKLITPKTVRLSAYQHVFYFVAYANLVFVFLITLVLALWRWL